MPRHDVAVLRDLAKRYADLAAHPVQEERRRLWRDHLSMRPRTRVPVLATYGMWNVWCREVFGDQAMQCDDPFYRGHERTLRMAIFHDSIGDDFILEPWLSQGAVHRRGWGNVWGVQEVRDAAPDDGGACRFVPVIREWADMSRLSWPPHAIDEAASREAADRLRDAIDGILPVDVTHGATCLGFMADISTSLGRLRGFEQIMIDMYESPDDLKRLLAFMRDGILANQTAAEQAGDLGLSNHQNQCMPYCHELMSPQPNSAPCRRSDLWGYCAAQEFTLISPAMHDEFMLQYQIPILKPFGLVAYGCCEDLSEKIAILRQIPNLRIIAAAPRADIAKCAEQVGADYVISWRPNPTDMVCGAFDETRIRGILRHGLAATRENTVHVHLKDIETVEGDPDRLRRWVRLVREVEEERA